MPLLWAKQCYRLITLYIWMDWQMTNNQASILVGWILIMEELPMKNSWNITSESSLLWEGKFQAGGNLRFALQAPVGRSLKERSFRKGSLLLIRVNG